MQTKSHSEPLVRIGPPIIHEPSAQQLAFVKSEMAAGRVLAIDTPAGRRLYTPYGPGRAVPISFTYSGTEPIPWWIHVQVNPEDGQARCVGLFLSAPMGGHITAEMARVPLGRLVEEAVLLMAIEVDADGKPIGDPIGDRATTVAEARRVHKSIEREHRRKKRVSGRNVTDELLREVASVYRNAIPTRRPTAATEAHFPWASRSTINRWVAEARKRGYLELAATKEEQ